MNTSPSILVITDKFLPHVSGVTFTIDTLYSRMLQAKNYSQVTLICGGGSAVSNETVKGFGVVGYESQKILGGFKLSFGMDFVRKLKEIVTKNKIDQIHIHSRFSSVSLISLFLLKFWNIKNVKIIYFEYFAGFVNYKGRLKNFVFWVLDKYLNKFLFDLPDKVVCISQSVKNFVISEFGTDPSKLTVVEKGYSINPSELSYREKFAHKDFYRIIWIGNLDFMNNPILFAQSLDILAQRRNDFMAYMIGDGFLKENLLEVLNKPGISSRIGHISYLSEYKLNEELMRSDVFVSIASLSGLSGNLLKSVVTSNIPLVSDIGGHRDIVAIPDLLISNINLTPESLADKIDNVLNSLNIVIPQLDNQRMHIINRFTWDNAINRMKML
jgi:glycosyltransferase involved in cell wall biosynthesis